MENSLNTIIERCKQNDRRAQKDLFVLMAPRLLSVSRQYCPKTSDPLDNLQDAFIKIFSYLNQFDDTKGSFESWARRIVINTSLDKINKKIIEESMSTFDTVDLPVKLSIDDVLDAEYILRIIEKLPDGYRQVFCLFEIEGYNHKEIAEHLNIKESTSRSQLSRSKILLQQWLIENEKTFSLKFQKLA